MTQTGLAILLVYISNVFLYQLQPTEAINSSNVTCHVPPYAAVSFHEVNVIAENEALLLTEGRCYLACLREGAYYQNFRFREEGTYPAWPFPVVTGTCVEQQKIHECTRGCRVLLLEYGVLLNPGSISDAIVDQCLVDCQADCREECNGLASCINPDTIDLWVAQSGCSNNCILRTACHNGCLTGKHVIVISTITPPPRPLTPPTLIPLSNVTEDIFRAGVFSVNLTSATPMRGQEAPPLYGFLFKIEDKSSGNITYLWQLPESPLQQLVEFAS